MIIVSTEIYSTYIINLEIPEKLCAKYCKIERRCTTDGK